MDNKERDYTSEFKAKVAMAALKGEKTLAELALEYGVQPQEVSQWKEQMQASATAVFSSGAGRSHRGKRSKTEAAAAHDEVDRLRVELAWLRKKARQLGLSADEPTP